MPIDSQVELRIAGFYQIFEHQVSLAPDSPALIFNDVLFTYRQLNQRANQIAYFLREQGVGSETLVGLCMDRSIEMIASLLGILKAGGAYVPLDPHYPAERLSFMIADSAAEILLTQSCVIPSLPNTLAKVIVVDLDNPQITQQPVTNLTINTSPDGPAYVIYTSGSTGLPKGVVVPHRGLCHLLESQIALFELTGHDRILQLASLSFDAATFEIVMALGSGASLYLGDRLDLLPGLQLLQLLQTYQISVMTITPSALALLPCDASLPHLRLINVAGETCPAMLVDRWGNGRQIFNLYGPTETTIWATYEECSGGEQPPPIGKAIPGVNVHVLDGDLQPVSAGVIGEMYIGGVGVTQGYWQKAALTAVSFLPDPFTSQPGSRLYKTGDLARLLPDGKLEFAGRIDNQVKIRGIRVELGEIENRLFQHPSVDQAAVRIRQNNSGSQTIVGYIIPRPELTPSSSELRHYLARSLPEHMIPELIMSLPEFPTTPNGKLDRQALPAPGGRRPDLPTPFVAPKTKSEQEIAAIWREVLELDAIGLHDNFFELGGHSLAVTQVVARIRDAFAIDVPLLALFEQPTVAQLTAYLDDSKSKTSLPVIPPINVMRSANQTSFPLSFSQERVWFMRELLPDNRAYNAQSSIRFRGALNIPVLEKTLTELVKRHEIWRTTFSLVNNRPLQHVHPAWTVNVPVVDLSQLPEDEREAQARRHIQEAFSHTFDTAVLPLLHWPLIKIAADDHILVQVEHHFIHDGWSFAIQQQEFKAIYTAFLRNKLSPLPPLPVQFADFVLWQRAWLQGDALNAQLGYWKQQLGGLAHVTEILTDHPRPPVQTLRGQALRTVIPVGLAQRLRTFSQEENATLFIVLLAGLKALLTRYTDQEDVVVGSSVANRRLPEIEGLIGMIVNNVTLRTDLSGQPTFREAVARVRETALHAYDHQDIPFERIVEALQPERDLSRNPFFQIIFSFHDAPVPSLDLPDVIGEITYHQNDSAKFDLNVLAIPLSGPQRAHGRLPMIWEYNRDLFERETIVLLAAHFERLLENALANPDARLSEIDFLTDNEEQAILHDWNETAVNFGGVSFAHDLVADQARQRGGKTAVSAPHASLTYQQLNDRANQLAHYLIEQGVGPETAVATCLPQSPLNVVAMLAVLKAGGAYVPLDPSYPSERLTFMAADAQVPLVLTGSHLAPLFDDAAVLSLDDWRFLADYATAETAVPIYPDNPAYIIYTSGSTGQPKGVVVTHRTLYNLIRWTQTSFDLDSNDRAALIAGTAFDASVWELWSALTAGAALFVPDPDMRTHPGQLQAWFIHNNITYAFVPTPLAEPMLDLEWPAETRLRFMLTGGDKLHKRPPTSLPFTLVNNYGPSECTVVSTSAPVAPQAPEKAPTIGRPIANIQVHILDKHLRSVPVGVPGELYVGGGGLARGYWRRSGLTAAAFIPDPFSQTPGARLYHTGDLVRYHANGSIEFLGRVDHQVKIRGFRIELGEIEALINQHPAVNKSIVIAHEQQCRKQLIAYVLSTNGRFDSHQLRAYLKPILPDYMIPTAFIHLEQFPLTPNGKINRRALPEPDQTALETTAVFTPPETLVEELLADIWRDVLSIERISIHDNFFELGGHSLFVTQVLSQLQESLDVTLPLRDFFAAPTIAQLAEIIEELLASILESEAL